MLELMMTNVCSQGSLVILTGRTVEGERWVVQVPFKPYFYVSDADVANEENADRWKDVHALEPGHRSVLDDRALTRVVVNSPTEIARKRRGLDHHEADIPHDRRFLIHMGIKTGFRVDSYTTLNADKNVILAVPDAISACDVSAPMTGILYDIETLKDPRTNKYSTPIETKAPISAITYNDVRWEGENVILGEKVVTLQWHPSNTVYGKPVVDSRWKFSFGMDREVEHEVWTFSNESEMLLHFIQTMKDEPRDVWAAWNGHYGFKTQRAPGGTGGYDAPYIINRLNRLGMGANQISPFNQAQARYMKRGDGGSMWICDIAGVQLVDLMTTYTIKDGGMTGSVEFSGLKDVVESKTDMPILKDPDNIAEWWEHHNESFLDYAFQDVDALMLLERQEDYVLYLKRFQWHCGMEDANTLFRPSTLIDSLVLRKAREIGVVLPSSNAGEEESSAERKGTGGYVIEPKKRGIRKNVVVNDVSAMYVAIMQSCNIGLDTLVSEGQERDDDILVPMDEEWKRVARFRSPKVKTSVVSLMLDGLRELRGYYDALIAKATSPAEIKSLKKQRDPSKQLLLTSYGVQRSRFGRLSNDVAGKAIPAAGRFLLTSVEVHCDEIEEPLFYADTDSGFQEAPTGTDPVDFGYWMERQLSGVFDKCAAKMNIETHNFKMGFEKLYSTYVMGRSKKNYAGIIVWAEGSYADPPHTNECDLKCPHLDMSGVAAVKHSTAPLTKELQKQVIQGILNGVDIDKLLKMVRSTYVAVKNGDIDLIDIVTAQRLNFDIDRDETDTAIVTGARNGRDLFGYTFKRGARVRIIQTKGALKWVGVPQEEGDIPIDSLNVDWEGHAKSAVLSPLKAIFEWIGEEDAFKAIEKGSVLTRQQRLTVE